MRIDPPETGPELDQLTSYLDLQRATMLWKTEGLTREQLAQPHPPSTLTLGGLLNHLALVEDSWFRVRFAGLPDDELWAGIDWDADPDYEFRTAAELEPEELRRRYEQACARSREVVAAAASLDQLSVRAPPQRRALRPALDAAAPDRGDRAARRPRRPDPGGDRRRGGGMRRPGKRNVSAPDPLVAEATPS